MSTHRCAEEKLRTHIYRMFTLKPDFNLKQNYVTEMRVEKRELTMCQAKYILRFARCIRKL